MTAKKAPEPRSAAELEALVQSFHDREDRAIAERNKLRLALGDASAAGSAEAVAKAQQELDARTHEDAAIAAGLESAERQLAEAREREEAEDRAALEVEMDKIFDKVERHFLTIIDLVNKIPAEANAGRAGLVDAKPMHVRLHPTNTPGPAIDRAMRPSWPWDLWAQFILGRVGSQFGQARSAGAADDAEQKLRTYIDRLRTKNRSTKP
jgi:hypothetical protein